MTQEPPQLASHQPVGNTGNHLLRGVLENLLIAAAYFVTAPLGQLLAIAPGNVTPVWIPSGIIFAAALARGSRVWPGIFLGAFAGNVRAYVDPSTLEGVMSALFSGTANGIGDAFGTVLGASLVRRFAGADRPFDTGRGVIVFIVCGALPAGMISATCGVTGLALADFVTRDEYAKLWITWSVGDVMGIMVLTPFFFEWRTWARSKLTARQWLEFVPMLLVLAMVTLCSMGVLFSVRTCVALMVTLPLLIPPVFRFHHGVPFFAVLMVSAITITATALGKGPFFGSNLNAALLELQFFLGMTTTTIYILTGVVSERCHAWQDLNHTSSELNETRLSLVEAERMRIIGQIAAGVAHEVKNPLAIISLGTDFLTRNLAESDATSKRVLEEIQVAISRADSTVLGLLDFGAPRKLTLKEAPVDELLHEAQLLTSHALTRRKVELHTDLPDNFPALRLDRDKCVQVLVNLILNACHAIGSQGRIRISGKVLDTAEESVVELLVDDSGPGIPEDVLPRLFEPFFTTRKNEGTGLGLFVSRMIMRLHGGDLSAGNRPEGGARFRITWPLPPAA